MTAYLISLLPKLQILAIFLTQFRLGYVATRSFVLELLGRISPLRPVADSHGFRALKYVYCFSRTCLHDCLRSPFHSNILGEGAAEKHRLGHRHNTLALPHIYLIGYQFISGLDGFDPNLSPAGTITLLCSFMKLKSLDMTWTPHHITLSNAPSLHFPALNTQSHSLEFLGVFTKECCDPQVLQVLLDMDSMPSLCHFKQLIRLDLTDTTLVGYARHGLSHSEDPKSTTLVTLSKTLSLTLRHLAHSVCSEIEAGVYLHWNTI